MLKAYKNLSPKTRAGVGIGLIAWSVVGLHLSDQAEKKLGYEPSEKDKEELWKWAPKVTTVDKSDSR
ncbi:fatty acid activator Faa4, putative [Metarhizium acridum CQMa 102]|uniref:Fatty acid activator Faa4, putative n=1 Tax=Metarhizium acridum (strain CQMa 102) TaxID=655827 RepID=E9DSY7_METAQ|nr:fatty acid activator Faa4, putative [Metarhizium acridum CQMa 102]EFY93497.1 fatty acid activator Faa4, putative [Metarhizium acridum CQMa 102]